MRKILAVMAILGFSVILGPAAARADVTLTFSDSTETPKVLVDGTLTAACFGQVGAPGEVCTGPTNFSTDATSVNLAFNIYDPGGVTLSDTLLISGTPNIVGGTDVFFTFTSDVEGGPALSALPGGSTIIEDGTVQAVAIILLSGSAAGQNLLVQFQSGVDTPEPASLLLLGTGLLGAALRRKLFA